MVKLYTDTTYLIEKNRKLIFPLLLDLWYLKNSKLLSLYEIVDIAEEADVFLLPLQYNHLVKFDSNFVKEFISMAKKLNKNIWIYTAGDFGYTIKDKSIITFRLGGFHSKMSKQTIIIPALIMDPFVNGCLNKFSVLAWEKKPSVGFVGHAHISALKLLKESYGYLKHSIKVLFRIVSEDYQPFYPSSIVRALILKKIGGSKMLKGNFIKRDNYRAGAKTQESKEKSSTEFFENIYNNPYTLCIRGVGNFSVRFYETLAVGRIPILIDTDCRLPLDNKINWNRHCVIVSNTNKIEEAILDFHNSYDENSFKKLQQTNRELWLNLLTREGFFKSIANQYQSK